MVEYMKKIDYIEKDLTPLAVDIDSVTPDPRNTRNHNDRSIDSIAQSLLAHKQKTPIVVDIDGVIRKGNGTWRAAKQLGWKQIAAVRSSDPTLLLRAYAIRDNRTAELSSWESEVLSEEIHQLNILPFDLGFNPDEWSSLVFDINTGSGLGFGSQKDPGDEDEGSGITISQKDDNIRVSLSFHPSAWIGSRTEILDIIEKIKKRYGCEAKVKE
jgi:hypothetical protein